MSIAVADDRDKIRRHVSTSAPSAKSSTPHWFDGEEGSRKFFHFRLKGEPVFINVMGIHRIFEPFRASGGRGGPSQPEEVFLGVMRQVQDRPVTEMSLFESFQDEYYTRHMLDGTIVFADQRSAFTRVLRGQCSTISSRSSHVSLQRLPIQDCLFGKVTSLFIPFTKRFAVYLFCFTIVEEDVEVSSLT